MVASFNFLDRTGFKDKGLEIPLYDDHDENFFTEFVEGYANTLHKDQVEKVRYEQRLSLEMEVEFENMKYISVWGTQIDSKLNQKRVNLFS